MDRTPELQQELADSNRHIVEGHARIARQREIIDHLSGDGHDVTDAENLLRTMVEDLQTMQARRQQIVRELELAEVRTRT
jgi:formyltetrahydrofolate synthetase